MTSDLGKSVDGVGLHGYRDHRQWSRSLLVNMEEGDRLQKMMCPKDVQTKAVVYTEV